MTSELTGEEADRVQPSPRSCTECRHKRCGSGWYVQSNMGIYRHNTRERFCFDCGDRQRWSASEVHPCSQLESIEPLTLSHAQQRSHAPLNAHAHNSHGSPASHIHSHVHNCAPTTKHSFTQTHTGSSPALPTNQQQPTTPHELGGFGSPASVAADPTPPPVPTAQNDNTTSLTPPPPATAEPTPPPVPATAATGACVCLFNRRRSEWSKVCDLGSTQGACNCL